MPEKMSNNMPNEDKKDPSLSASSKDAATNSTSDADSPNEVGVDGISDADNPDEAGTSSTTNGTPGNAPDNAPNSASNGTLENTPNDTSVSASDNSPASVSSTPQHPHRRRNITIGIIIAVVVVAAIACILAFTHPWDAEDNNDTTSNESNSSSSESSLQIDEPEGISGEDNATEHPENANEHDEPGDTGDPNAFGDNNNTGDPNASDNNNTGDNSLQNESGKDATADPEDTTTESGDIPTIPSEWITGPQTFDSEEDAERFEAGEWHTDKSLRSRYGFKQVKTDDGTIYVAGELIVVVPQSATDESVTFIAQKLGGVIAEIYDSELFDERRVTIVFPDNANIEKLSEDADRLDGVRSAHVDSVGSIEEINNVDGDKQADIVDLSFTNDPLISS